MTTDSNSTVLGVAPMSKTLPVVGIVLILLFVLIKPEATAGLGFVSRLVFWTVHIGLSLGGLVVASALLRPASLRSIPLPLAILATGLAASALLAPVFVLLEAVTPVGQAEAPDSWLDRFAAGGWPQAVLAEFLEFAPVFLAAWFAVNLPLLLSRVSENDRPVPPADTPGDDPGPSASGGGGGQAAARNEDDPRERFLATLPKALGRDVVAVSSDMHYLHVHTTLGKCMVLGTLRDVADALGNGGLRVHRSHWVAHAHVRRIARRGSSWECLMSNDLKIPVSRRKQAEVASWYGSSGTVVKMASRKTG